MRVTGNIFTVSVLVVGFFIGALSNAQQPGGGCPPPRVINKFGQCVKLEVINYSEANLLEDVEQQLPPNKDDGSLRGVDVDEDGVRDDIEHYIQTLYKNKTDRQLRNSLYGIARYLNQEDLSPSSDSRLSTRDIEYVNHRLCLEYALRRVDIGAELRGSYSKVGYEIVMLETEMFATDSARINWYYASRAGKISREESLLQLHNLLDWSSLGQGKYCAFSGFIGR